MCATLYIYTRFRFSLFGNVPSVFDPLEPGGTIVPFTIGWRCHFRTIAHDPPSARSYFILACTETNQGIRYWPVCTHIILFFTYVPRVIRLFRRPYTSEAGQICNPFANGVCFFESRNTKLEGQWRKLPPTEYTCRRNTREIREILS